MWSDNNIVKTLSNFHLPTILVILAEGEEVLRKRKVDGEHERHQSWVPCPIQNQDYSGTYHWIDKGNGVESNFDMDGTSRTHNWAPELTMSHFNMTLNNAF